jgi:hypothetical protein
VIVRGRVNEEDKRGRIWLMYFLIMYEYGTLKPVEVTSRRGVEKDREKWRG